MAGYQERHRLDKAPDCSLLASFFGSHNEYFKNRKSNGSCALVSGLGALMTWESWRPLFCTLSLSLFISRMELCTKETCYWHQNARAMLRNWDFKEQILATRFARFYHRSLHCIWIWHHRPDCVLANCACASSKASTAKDLAIDMNTKNINTPFLIYSKRLSESDSAPSPFHIQRGTGVVARGIVMRLQDRREAILRGEMICVLPLVGWAGAGHRDGLR